MQTKMTIRPIIPQDKEKLFRLLTQRGTFNEKEIEVAMEVIEDSLLYPEKEEYYTFCALNDTDELAGFICFGPIPMTDGCYDLYWIAVDEKFSRNGVGEKLLEKMEDFAMSEKARRIYSDTSSTDPYAAARFFYKKHGFDVIAVLDDFYRNGDHKMIFMKNLNRDKVS
jgi:ribosomal protein S18 acetylase RimI-like enzyme